MSLRISKVLINRFNGQPKKEKKKKKEREREKEIIIQSSPGKISTKATISWARLHAL